MSTETALELETHIDESNSPAPVREGDAHAPVRSPRMGPWGSRTPMAGWTGITGTELHVTEGPSPHARERGVHGDSTHEGAAHRNGCEPTHGELELRQVVQGRRPGERYVRIARHKGFKRLGHGLLVPRAEQTRPKGRLAPSAGCCSAARSRPPARSHERLTKVKALAVFSSDALSSVAYATEEIMKVLVLGGLGAALADDADLAADRGAAGDRRAVVSADDRGVSVWRRQLHRRQRQPRQDGRPDRRRPRC